LQRTRLALELDKALRARTTGLDATYRHMS
jgi:hypothetical protein